MIYYFELMQRFIIKSWSCRTCIPIPRPPSLYLSLYVSLVEETTEMVHLNSLNKFGMAFD